MNSVPTGHLKPIKNMKKEKVNYVVRTTCIFIQNSQKAFKNIENEKINIFKKI